jgi:NADH-quinone oxidoreductase subunit J
MDLLLVGFAAASIAAVIFTLGMLLFREIVHAVFSLVLLLATVSLLFVFLGQPLLAIIQLFIMVGGIATYFMISSASANLHQFKRTNIPLFIVIAAIMFAALAYPLMQSRVQNYSTYSAFTGTLFAYNQPVFFLIIIVLFGISISALLLFKKVRFK